MATTQYIGARYVPVFAEPIYWNNERTYEPLTIVLHEGNSYTSMQYVPSGVDISNEKFWAETGNYNAQVESYRRDVLDVLDLLNVTTYANINEMLEDTHLKNGNYAYIQNGALFQICDTGSANNMDIQKLENGLFANLCYTNYINVLWLNCPTDGVTNASPYIQRAMELVPNTYVPSGTYAIGDTLLMQEKHSIFGDGYHTVLQASNLTTSLFNLASNKSVKFKISNLNLNGRTFCNNAINFSRSEYDVSYVDTNIILEYLYCFDFADYAINIGTTGTTGIAEMLLNRIIVERSGSGFSFGPHMTDSIIMDCIVGGASKHHGFTVQGYNLEFRGCKSYYTHNNYSGFLFYRNANISGRIEAQDTSGNGVIIHGVNTINLEMALDKCGAADGSVAALLINDNTSTFNLTAVVSNNETSTQYSSARAFDVENGAVNGILNITCRNNIQMFDTAHLSGNIKFTLNSANIVYDFTPSASKAPIIPNEITVLNDHLIKVNGTFSSSISFYLYGSYSLDTTNYFTLPKGIAHASAQMKKMPIHFFNGRTIIGSITDYDLIVTEPLQVTGVSVTIPAGTYDNELVDVSITLVTEDMN